MSIEFIAGKPGNGKSLLAVKQLVETLRSKPDTFIATNLALNIPRLCEYLHEKYKETFEANRRIRLLTDMECSEFWLYPYPGIDLDGSIRIKIVRRGAMSKDVVDIASQREAVGGFPVTFIIDEVHQYFGAREWAATGTDCLHYLSQHRKLGDDVIAVTQAIENVDAQFRRVAQSFHYVKNLRKTSIPLLGGLFKAPPLFVRSEYLSPFTGKQTSTSSSHFTLDAKGIASCYETASGVGLVGRFADKGEVKKGIPWYVLLIGIAVLGAGAIMAPKAIMKRVLGGGSFKTKTAGVSTNKAPAIAESSVVQNPGSPAVKAVEFAGGPLSVQDPVRSAAQVPPLPFVESQDVFWVARVKMPSGRWMIGLSDGRTLYTPDARIKMVSEDAILIGTNSYLWGRREKAPVLHEQMVASSAPASRRPAAGSSSPFSLFGKP